MIRLAPGLLIMVVLVGCHPKETGITPSQTGDSKPMDSIRYANGFTIQVQKKYTVLTVVNPWQQADNIEFTYFLTDSSQSAKSLPDHSCIIKTPVKRVICLSTTHIGYISFLNQTKTICGISGKNYVVNPDLRQKIREGLVKDVGYDENLNYELIIKLKPDVVFAYGVNGSVTNTINKLKEMGIPVVVVADYLEESPLAKAEWIKFFASFYNLEGQAVKSFDAIAVNYSSLSDRANAGGLNKPTVLLGLPWHGTWYISGGKSYVAKLVADAGGNYLWSALPFKDSQPMQLESVFAKALQADFWLNAGDAKTKSDIILVDERFNKLKAFTSDRVYNNNLCMSTGGGNAYFETGVMEPDIILSDLVAILHPQLLPSHKFKYYCKLQ